MEKTPVEYLKEKYTAAGFVFKAQRSDGATFDLNGRPLLLDNSDISSFSEVYPYVDKYEVYSKCGISNGTYREHALRSVSQIFFLTGLGPTGKVNFFDEGGSGPSIEVSRASILFKSIFRFRSGYIERSIATAGNSWVTKFSETLVNPYTIKIFNINESSPLEAVRKTDVLVESALFHLTYEKGACFRLEDDWAAGQKKVGGKKVNQDDIYPLPKASYIADLINFYQLGMSSNIAVLQFLSFYHVLEYFFVSTSDEILYGKIKEKLVDPSFRIEEHWLSKIVKSVDGHKRESDETEMLKNVIEKYVDEDDLIEFISEFEAEVGEKLYTRKRNVFGIDIEIKLNKGHVIGNVSKLIKNIRNAIVHSSDRYQREDVHIPFSKGAMEIEKEVPLVRFLAEKVIVSTGRGF